MESKEESQFLSLGDLRNAIGISQTPPLSLGDEAGRNEPELSLSSADLLSALGYRMPPIHETKKTSLSSAPRPALRPTNALAGKAKKNRQGSAPQHKPDHEKPAQEAPEQASRRTAARSAEKQPPERPGAKAPQLKSNPMPKGDDAKQEIASPDKTAPAKPSVPPERKELARPMQKTEAAAEPASSRWEEELKSAAEQIESRPDRPEHRAQKPSAKQPPSSQWQPPRLDSNVLTWTPMPDQADRTPHLRAASSSLGKLTEPTSAEKADVTATPVKEMRDKEQEPSPPPSSVLKMTEEKKAEAAVTSPLPKDEAKPIITFIPSKDANPAQRASARQPSSKKDTESPSDSVRAAAEKKLAERVTNPLPIDESDDSPASSEKGDEDESARNEETRETSPDDLSAEKTEADTLAPAEPSTDGNWHLEQLQDILHDRTPFVVAALVLLIIAICVSVAVLLPGSPSVDSNADSSARETPVETVYYLPEATLYSYDILGTDDESYRITEVAEFGEDGFLERSILTIDLDTPEQAEEFLKQAKETYQDDLLASGTNENTAMLIVKPSDPNISQDTYTNLHKDTKSNCQIIGE